MTILPTKRFQVLLKHAHREIVYLYSICISKKR